MEAYLDQLRKDGVTVVTYTREEIERLADAVQKDAWPLMKDKVGDELHKLISERFVD